MWNQTCVKIIVRPCTLRQKPQGVHTAAHVDRQCRDVFVHSRHLHPGDIREPSELRRGGGAFNALKFSAHAVSVSIQAFCIYACRYTRATPRRIGWRCISTPPVGCWYVEREMFVSTRQEKRDTGERRLMGLHASSAKRAPSLHSTDLKQSGVF